MEIIEVTGYLMEEKREIAKRHLIPKQLENHGITAGHVTIPDEIIDLIIEKYTRESGVRSLDMTIAKIMRHVARKVAMNKKFTITLDENKVKEYLGSPIFSREEYQGNRCRDRISLDSRRRRNSLYRIELQQRQRAS